MARDSVIGEGTVDRLTARAERQELSRESVAGGGEVFQGPLATRALNTLGARAMTLDSSVIVGDDFDMSRIEDQALYAHEMTHVDQGHEGGGGGGVGLHDAEEVAARAAESAVLARTMVGGYEPGFSPGAGSLGQSQGHKSMEQEGKGSGASTQSAEEKPEDVDVDPSAERGYDLLKERGYSHMDIVDEMARKAIAGLNERDEVSTERFKDMKGWL